MKDYHELLDRLNLERYACAFGSPSDQEVAAAHLACMAENHIPELVEAVQSLRAELKALQAAAPQWLEPNSGPRSTWEGDTQVVHPALVARTDAEAPELAYYCDIDEDWLSFKNGERVRLYDVEAWMPLPALPRD